ncbi:hypothetical protein [Pyxidicoccus trucidator]|uniref:hypothetical protein n=1 Tax=Pyxidicoccus trucidator TaxID=2709662 RepID=UPI0013DC9B56|nr:hypothetical protein [Pyxidicoccus trucidator]
MPSRVRWTVLGILGLSVLMCGGGCSAGAQSEETGPKRAETGAEAPKQEGGQALPESEAGELWGTVAELRAEVSQLREDVRRLRAQVAELDGEGSSPGDARADAVRSGAGAAQGTGGSGTAGGTGTQAPIVSDVPPTGSGMRAPTGTAVVNAVYTGVVRSVSEQQVVIEMEDGAELRLSLYPKTQVLREGRSIGVKQLKKGEQVRAVVDLVGQDKTLEIAVLPAAPEE